MANNKTLSVISSLKKSKEDYEWYPTTDELIQAVIDDYISSIKALKKECNTSKSVSLLDPRQKKIYATTPSDGQQLKFVDIGAGDGRVGLKLREAFKKNKSMHDITLYGVEKSIIHQAALMRNGYRIVGSDLWETNLLNVRADILFCNPPYSEYTEWLEVITKYVRAKFYYFIVPDRVKSNARLLSNIKVVGDISFLGDFDFLNGDRVARAKVALIKVEIRDVQENPFEKWVTANIGNFDFDDANAPKPQHENAAKKKELTISNVDDAINILVKNFNEDLGHMAESFRALSKVDKSILTSIGVDKDRILAEIKDGVECLKQQYWREAMAVVDVFTEKLTFNTRQELVGNIDKYVINKKALDFNESNIRMVIIYVLDNHASIMEKQISSMLTSLRPIDGKGATPYKSNYHWQKGDWRYTKENLSHYKLDYRFIVRASCLDKKASYKLSTSKIEQNNIIYDLIVVAEALGYRVDKNNSQLDFEPDRKEKQVLCKDGTVLLSYKYYKNYNLHLKLDKKFLLRFNIFVAKVLNWLTSPDDIAEEFDISTDEAQAEYLQSPLDAVDKNQLIKLLS